MPLIVPLELVTPVINPSTAWMGSKLAGLPVAESNVELPTVKLSPRSFAEFTEL